MLGVLLCKCTMLHVVSAVCYNSLKINKIHKYELYYNNNENKTNKSTSKIQYFFILL